MEATMSSTYCGCDPDFVDAHGVKGHLCERHQKDVDDLDRHAAAQPPIPQNLIYPKATNPKFDAVITQMVETHNRKSADYAKDANRYSNFEESAATAGCSVDTVFLVMIGVKLARLRELLSSGKTAQNESVQDSRMDLAVYAALWASYHTETP